MVTLSSDQFRTFDRKWFHGKSTSQFLSRVLAVEGRRLQNVLIGRNICECPLCSTKNHSWHHNQISKTSQYFLIFSFTNYFYPKYLDHSQCGKEKTVISKSRQIKVVCKKVDFTNSLCKWDFTISTLVMDHEQNFCESSMNIISFFTFCVKHEICEWWFFS